MARFIKGINGGYSGKVGNVVGSNWRSIDYVRSLSKKSKKPATELQLLQRAKFGMAVGFLGPIKDVLNLGYSDVRLNQATGYNMALKHVLESGLSGAVIPDLELVYANVQISKGSIGGLASLSTTEDVPGQLTLTWENRVNRFNSFADDAVIVLTYNVEDRFFSIYEDVTRGDATYSIVFPASDSGKTIVGWAFAGNRDGVRTSNSQFLGEHVLT